MARLLIFIVVVFLLGLGFAWLADRPGNMVVVFEGWQYRISLMAAATALLGAIVAVMLCWWIIKSVWTSPYTISRYFRVRRRDRGYQALSTGMIAAGAGDAVTARLKNKEAAKLINSDQEPLIHLLEAQALLLEGSHERAREKFEQMIDDPETRLLGLRGLYVEAERVGDRDAARHFAARAADIAPQLNWATEVTVEECVERGDWDAALKLLAAQKSGSAPDPSLIERRRGIVLTAKAIATFETDQPGSRAAALEAQRLLPTFAPTAVIAARALFRSDEVRKGSKILEAAWQAEPHRDIAELYTHARHGDATLDRLARAKRLQELNGSDVEAPLTVARTAFEAHDYALARREVEKAIKMEPRQSAYLLLADIEEAESGNIGRVREWLARAVRASRDPAWVADGVISQEWSPASPVTGRLDAFEWTVPTEIGGPLIDMEERLALPDRVAADIVDAEVEGAAIQPPDEHPVDSIASEQFEPRLPDDPGVDPSDKKPSGRFRLF